jgi:predicted hotdog family 3-hydroxylacyl-ACP dehydratase
VLDYMSRAAEAIDALAGWVQAGKIKNKVDVGMALSTRRRRCGGCSRAATRSNYPRVAE